MSQARENILGRLRGAGATAEPARQEISTSEPAWSAREKRLRFIDRLTAVRAEVIETDAASVGAVLAGWIEGRGLRTLLHDPASLWADAIAAAAEEAAEFPRLLAFDQEIETWRDELFHAVDAAITTTLGGIAETGSLILWPTPDEPRSMSLVPPVHIAIVEEERLFATFSEAIDKQGWREKMPTNALLISGPSKSADIERTLAYGVHGPKALVVLLVRSEETAADESEDEGAEDG